MKRHGRGDLGGTFVSFLSLSSLFLCIGNGRFWSSVIFRVAHIFTLLLVAQPSVSFLIFCRLSQQLHSNLFLCAERAIAQTFLKSKRNKATHDKETGIYAEKMVNFIVESTKPTPRIYNRKSTKRKRETDIKHQRKDMHCTDASTLAQKNARNKERATAGSSPLVIRS
jgi:hypothetical protein